MGHLARAFAIVERILRDRSGHFAEIGQRQALPSKIGDMLTVSLLGLGLFGAAMGLTGGLPWMLASTLKLPVLFLASLAICLPTLCSSSPSRTLSKRDNFVTSTAWGSISTP